MLKLLHIHDLVRFCKQGVVAAYHFVYESVVESVVGIRRTPSHLHSQQQIPTQHDTLPQQQTGVTLSPHHRQENTAPQDNVVRLVGLYNAVVMNVLYFCALCLVWPKGLIKEDISMANHNNNNNHHHVPEGLGVFPVP